MDYVQCVCEYNTDDRSNFLGEDKKSILYVCILTRNVNGQVRVVWESGGYTVKRTCLLGV